MQIKKGAARTGAAANSAAAGSASTPAGPALRMSDVDFRYQAGQALVLEHFSLELAAGEGLLLSGHNGAGKSTVFRLLLGLEQPQAGSIEIFGQSPAQARELVSFLPQSSSTDWNSPITVAQLVASSLPAFLLPFWSRMRRAGTSKWQAGNSTAGGTAPGSKAEPAAKPATKHAKLDAQVEAALHEMDLADLANRPISELSGGQRQRATFARTLARGGRLLLLDEPFNHLDQKTRKLSIAALEAALESGRTIILAEHETDLLGSLLRRSINLEPQHDGGP